MEPLSDQTKIERVVLLTNSQPGHEYTKSNVKFAISVLQSDPVKKLQAFADTNQVTTGKFTIGDEKVRIASSRHFTPYRSAQLTPASNITYSCA